MYRTFFMSVYLLKSEPLLLFCSQYVRLDVNDDIFNHFLKYIKVTYMDAHFDLFFLYSQSYFSVF